MSVKSIFIYTIWFVVFSAYLGNYYSKWNISQNVWLGITIITSIVLIIDFIMERILHKEKEQEKDF